MSSIAPDLPPRPFDYHAYPPSPPPPVAPVPPAVSAAEAPFSAAELRSAARRPHRIIDLVLAERGRLARTVVEGEHLVLLGAILVVASVLFTLPYGAILGSASTAEGATFGPTGAWRVAALNLGSVAICFPSLHIFSCYLGGKNRASQNLVVALLVSAVAGMFALGFAPILWFVRLTTSGEASAAAGVSAFLLGASVLAGALHFGRTCSCALSLGAAHRLLMAGWACLLFFVARRMGLFLDLL